MKITGKELTEFLDTGWPDDDWYWETELFETTPGGLPVADETYDTRDLGPLLWQGQGDDPSNAHGLNLDTLIRRWRKDRGTRIVTVRVPVDTTDKDIRAALKTLGYTLET